VVDESETHKILFRDLVRPHLQAENQVCSRQLRGTIYHKYVQFRMLSRYNPLYPYKYIVMLLTVITLTINYYIQRRWHISEVQIQLYTLLLLLLLLLLF